MGLFKNLGTDGLEEKEDRVGGGAGWVVDTDVYEMTIKMAYAGKSAGGAQFVAFTFAQEDGKEYSETFYVTSKTGQNYFMAKDKDGKETGKKRALPGFDHVNDICLVTTDKPLSEQNDEEKTVKVYDADAKGQIPKAVPVLVELLGQKIWLAIYKRLENKNAKNGNGEYEATADTRDTNTVEKVFHFPTMLTVKEATDGRAEPAFFPAWVESHKGKIADKRTLKDGEAGKTGRPGGNRAGAPPASGSGTTTAARPSLFGKK